MWGDDRSMYVFKAKATDDEAADGAKLYLALPLDTMSVTTDVFTNDSIAVVFGTAMLAQINGMIAEQAVSAPEDAKAVYNYIVNGDMAGTDEVQPLTLAEMNAFADGADAEGGIASFQTMARSINAMVNPAFYTDEDGFIGTLDDSVVDSEVYYQWDGTAQALAATEETTFTDVIDGLNSLDLSAVVPYVPADVVSATITVE
jgi:hypothetical protein